MTRDEIVEAAHHWIDAWNARDVESVLGHFEESARFTSPKALATKGCAIVEGRAALRAYWRARLRRNPFAAIHARSRAVGRGAADGDDSLRREDRRSAGARV
jgi:hypothetical protein